MGSTQVFTVMWIFCFKSFPFLSDAFSCYWWKINAQCSAVFQYLHSYCIICVKTCLRQKRVQKSLNVSSAIIVLLGSCITAILVWTLASQCNDFSMSISATMNVCSRKFSLFMWEFVVLQSLLIVSLDIFEYVLWPTHFRVHTNTLKCLSTLPFQNSNCSRFFSKWKCN